MGAVICLVRVLSCLFRTLLTEVVAAKLDGQCKARFV